MGTIPRFAGARPRDAAPHRAREDPGRPRDRTPEACIRLYFALMILGCEQDLPVEAVVEEGRSVLSGLIGSPLATLIFGDLDRTLPKIGDLRTLREYLEEGLRIWLPT